MEVIVLVLLFMSASANSTNETTNDTTVPVHKNSLEQVSIQLNNVHHCAGSILDETTVLSAAHCFFRYRLSTFTILIGRNLAASNARIRIFDVRLHENFSAITLVNDIAIVKLYDPILLHAVGLPMTLDKNFTDGDLRFKLNGWNFGLQGVANSVLLTIDVFSLNHQSCQSRFPQKLSESQLCTIVVPGQNPCVGEGGGVLLNDGKQVGILSWNKGCIRKFPTIFTKISSFLRWIEDNRK